MSQEKLSALLAIIVPVILQQLMKRRRIDSKEAADILYNSNLYEMLKNEESKLWHLSVETLYSLLEYTVSASDGYPSSYPFTIDMIYKATIDGTYSGYTVKGRYNYELAESVTSSTVYRMSYTYDDVISVSYNGKGAKIVLTGTYLMDSSPIGMTYNLHYKVYDNENVQRYNFDYSYTYSDDSTEEQSTHSETEDETFAWLNGIAEQKYVPTNGTLFHWYWYSNFIVLDTLKSTFRESYTESYYKYPSMTNDWGKETIRIEHNIGTNHWSVEHFYYGDGHSLQFEVWKYTEIE